MDRYSDECRPRQNNQFKVLVFWMLFFPFVSSAAPELLDRVEATVGEEPILRSQILAKLKRGQAMTVSYFPLPDTATDYDKALADQINFELIQQKAEQLEIEVSEEELDQAIEKFLSERRMTMDSLREALRTDGITMEEYRQDFSKQLLLGEFHGKVIYPLIKITENDIENYYLKKNGRTSASVKVSIDQYRIENSDAQQIRLDAEQLFADLKAKLSAAQISAKAGKMKSKISRSEFDVNLSDLDQSVRGRIEPLAVGEASPPFELNGGLMVFFVKQRQLTGSSDFDTQRARLLNELRMQETQVQTMKWLTDQRRLLKPSILAKP